MRMAVGPSFGTWGPTSGHSFIKEWFSLTQKLFTTKISSVWVGPTVEHLLRVRPVVAGPAVCQSCSENSSFMGAITISCTKGCVYVTNWRVGQKLRRGSTALQYVLSTQLRSIGTENACGYERTVEKMHNAVGLIRSLRNTQVWKRRGGRKGRRREGKREYRDNSP